MADYYGKSGFEQFARNLEVFADTEIDENVQQATYIAGVEVQKVARRLSAIDTGALRRSIGVSQVSIGTSALKTIIAPTEKYAPSIEFGRPPGTYVSPKALAVWASRKGLNPYAVSKSIYKKGSPAQPFLFPAFEEKKSDILKIVQKGIDNAIERLANK